LPAALSDVSPAYRSEPLRTARHWRRLAQNWRTAALLARRALPSELLAQPAAPASQPKDRRPPPPPRAPLRLAQGPLVEVGEVLPRSGELPREVVEHEIRSFQRHQRAVEVDQCERGASVGPRDRPEEERDASGSRHALPRSACAPAKIPPPSRARVRAFGDAGTPAGPSGHRGSGASSPPKRPRQGR